MSQALLTKAQKKISGQSANEYKTFFKKFYKNVPQEDYAMMAPENLAYTAQNHLKLRKSRKTGSKPAISIYTPTRKKEGWDAGQTVIDIVNDDMAFLVDSVVAEIIRHQYQISVFIHPMIDFKQNGKINKQSHIHVELNRVLSAAEKKELQKNINKVLSDTKYANKDWKKIRAKLLDAKIALNSAPKKYDAELITEYQDFLQYLHDDNFTILGYREYSFSKSNGKLKSKVVKGSSLGLLSDEVQPVYINEAQKALTEKQQELRVKQKPLTISKVNKRSTVHRRVPMDAISVKTYN